MHNSRRWLFAGAGMLALAVSARPAEASFLPFQGCAFGSSASFKVCTSADVRYDQATGTLFFDIRNLNQSSQSNPSFADYASPTGGWHTIKAFGLSNMMVGTHYTLVGGGLSLGLQYWNGTQFESIDPTAWAVDANSLQIENTGAGTSGHKHGIVGGYDPGPTGKNHLQTVDTRFAQFAITGFASFAFSPDIVFEWHSLQVATESCTDINKKCATQMSLKGSSTPDQVVPEPLTMALLGTGLAGVFAARRRRRTGTSDAALDDGPHDR